MTLVYFISVPALNIYPDIVYSVWLIVSDIFLRNDSNITYNFGIILLMIFDILWLNIVIYILGYYVDYISEIPYKCILHHD